MNAFRAGIITVSDTASADASSDRSGPVLSEHLLTAGFSDVQRSVSPDDVQSIQTQLLRMVDSQHVHLIVTTGGTGFGLRDVTPEAVEPLITRKTPALTHALTNHSLQKTPLAALSRGITGIRRSPSGKEALIVCLPGSPKAVKECLEVLLGNDLLKHALELLNGGSGEAKHKEMQGGMHRSTVIDTATDTGCAHHHHHHGGGGIHSHSAPKPRTTPADHSGFRTIDPSSGPSLRHRTSPYPLVDLDEALSLIAKHTPAPTKVETLPLNTSLIGHVLAEDVSATSDLPPGPTTNVDGYAVNAATTPPGKYTVVTLKALQSRSLQPGEIFRINTGQGLPSGTDSVVMVEDTELISSDDASGEEVSVKLLAQVDPGENVRARGSDVRASQLVLPRGTTISALGGEIGTLAFLGRSCAKVFRKPTIAILSTGNELVDPTPSSSQTKTDWGFNVFDSNRPGLTAAITGLGFNVLDLGITTDNVDTTLRALRTGLSEADVVLTTGGTSMGESDLLKPLIERQLAGRIHFGRVAMKPGKPTTFASLNEGEKIIFALPGNPASALVTFYVFVLPCLRKLSGVPPSVEDGWNLPKVNVKLSSGMKLDPRPEFHRVVVKVDADGELVAYSTGSQRSSGMHSMSTANALIALPALQKDGQRMVEKGSRVRAILLGAVV
ncbi:molybdenum cofactor biosynthesis protein [Pseudozyma hubeiensis SY62]|uniref:Molybdenum cofactor biosynthesis protein n=1 Tax=Pseudozyma hubeiensis (strain SY62) TaxID=1305764 RepID=R9P1P3_PSEHS|nr:molybdenum cofactor biosynthesis protein [Pseudozyma hubeiensis SY62]GAC95067.1 molybdenum cofactor biosynthesis protein [Pseudozyma hubeiensis SY62]